MSGDPDEPGITPVSSSLDRVLRSLGGPSSSSMVALAGRWVEVVGEDLVGRCAPAELTADGVLVVVADPAFVTALRFSALRLVDAANRVVGGTTVTTIEVRARR